MGSRIMHLMIANRMADKLEMKDRTSFLLGGIAPDAVSSRETSHFFRGDHSDYTRHVDYHEFLKKYHSVKDSPYILGYYTHLIADDLWLQGFYLPWLKNRIETDESILEAYHNDFKLLNGKLLDYYGCLDELRELLMSPSKLPKLEEIPEGNLEKFLPFVLEDMDYNQSDLDEELTVFTLDQIVGYIETAVDKGVFHIKPLLGS